MATPPSFSAAGSVAQSNSAPISVAWPAHVAGQLGILLIVTENNAAGTPASTVNPTSGLTAVANGNQVVGLSTTGCRMQVYRKMATSSSEPNITVPIGSNTHVYAKIFTFDGCTQTANPVPASAGSSQSTPSTTVTYPGITTLSDSNLVVCLCANSTNNDSMSGSMTNASLTSIIKHQTTNTSFVTSAILSGIKTTAGVVSSGSSTWTPTSSSHVSVTLALAPTPDVVTIIPEADIITPVRDGYSVILQNAYKDIPLEGGPGRKRQDVAYAPHQINASWIIHRDEYSAFMGFWRQTLGSYFLIDLITDIGIPTLHRCRSVGGIPKLTRQTGEAYYVSCSLEAEQNATFTGTIKYQEPGNIIFSTLPYILCEELRAGDLVRIIDSKGVHPTGSTPLDLDGVYLISSTTGGDQITLSVPTAVNAGWTTLAGLGSPGEYGDAAHGNVISTITKVPT